MLDKHSKIYYSTHYSISFVFITLQELKMSHLKIKFGHLKVNSMTHYDLWKEDRLISIKND